ncbi:hypothetical protein TSUD_425760, partial [Trifolium subterraneum]
DNTSAESTQNTQDMVIPTVSLSASDEIDPDNIDLTTPPPKRLGKQLESSHEIVNVDNVVGSKASSTKMMKKPKKE